MRRNQTCVAAARIAGAIALAAWTSAARPACALAPKASLITSVAFAPIATDTAPDSWTAQPGMQTGADAAHGTGFLSWWRGHGKEVAEAIGCALDGAALGRMLALGMTAVGGAWAAAGLAAAALACLA
jgi:hypothetical protein